MASNGRPPTSARSRYTTPTRKTPATETFYNSPLSRFTSPSSSTSNFSFSPSSAGFLSLAGAAATTPLSSIDGGEIDCPSSFSSSTTADDRDQHEPLLAFDNNNSNRPQKSQVAPALSRLSQVDAVAPSATNTAAMTKSTAQSTISIRDSNAPADRGPKQNNTEAKKCTSDSYPARLSYDNTLDAPARNSIDKVPNESPVLSPSATTTTLPWSQAQPITSDLIRRVSSSRSIAHSTASPILSLSSPVLRPAPTLITTTIVQPKAIRSPTSPLQQQLPAFAQSPSSHGSPSHRTTISAHCSSVAQLEETAEHFANTGSIETAIREAHQELKRSDSRRSSILAAGVRQAQAASRTASRSASRAATVPDPSDAHPADLSSLSRKSSLTQTRRDYSRQSSIIGLNSAARTGAYTPYDYIMSPTASVVGLSRQPSASKASSAGDDSFPVLSRHGTGKSSVRSVQSQSGKQSLAEIVEHEPPMTITQEALDEADRRIAAGEDHEDDDTIRAIAHQHVGDDSYDKDDLHTGNSAFSSSPDTDVGLLSTQTPSPMARPSVADYLGFPSAQKYEPLSTTYPEYDPSGQMHAQSAQSSHQQTDMEAQATEIERPTTSGSGGTFQQAQTAFKDFDGVHCDPDNASIRHRPYFIQHADRHAPGNHQPQLPDDLAHTSSPRYKPHLAQAARPTSYMDPSTGQQMLYYPAPVPAMLNLPPKLSKNPKAAERNARRSQVLSMMMQNNEPKPERESRVWLPDPITSDISSPLMDTFGTGEASPAASGLGDGSQSTSKAPLAIDPEVAANADSGPKTGSTGRGDTGHLRRPPRITDTDKHKSRMSALNKLPPQLRASAYFDHPSSNTNIQLKDGSATATLESILQASTSAPVSAFTDHAFAGHLGSEVYGIEKKRAKRASAANARKSAAIPQPAPPHELRKSKSKSSFMSLVGLDHVRRISEPMDGDAQRPRRRLSKNFDGAMKSPGLSDGGNLMAPGDDERTSDEDGENDRLQGRAGGDEEGGEEDEEDEEDADQMYEEAPTTLLAELQIRKRQQKLRTRPINQAFPNGMHSTLLELDIVAEMERKARKGKKVNLAWEDPSLGDAESDDEDVPLGMLFAARAAGHTEFSAVAAEINRPLGLLEKKQMEDNEPLSRRRERLQGRGAGAGMYLRPSHSANALRHQSMLTMTPSMMALNKAHSLSHPHSTIAPEDAEANGGTSPAVEEVEDEPLAARKLRIKAKEESQLPRARPVSTAFSEELLGQFVDPAEEEAAKEQEKKDKLAKSKAQPSEEEETLGQRRRRLQAEKDAREQEMGGLSYGLGPGPAVNNQALEALNGDGLATPGRLSRRLSMADVLGAHPLSSAMGAQNPREAERMRREQEAARVAHERDQKMAAIRAQMPHGSNGSGINRSGGFLGGRFNDGSGGVLMQNQAPIAQHYSKMGSTPNLHGGMNTMLTPVHNMNNMNRNTVYGGYGGMSQPNLLGHVGMVPNSRMAVGGGYGSQGMQQMPMQQMQMPMGMSGQMAMPMQVPMPIPGQPQIERVERWRQSIQP